FFSSRRRHTRFSRDWSSDVCSSDLFFPLGQRDDGGQVPRQAIVQVRGQAPALFAERASRRFPAFLLMQTLQLPLLLVEALRQVRSEERRVGEECRRRARQSE